MDVSKLVITSDSNHKKIINGQYKIVRKIGEGQNGKVLVSETIKGGDFAGKVTDSLVAIKTINRLDKAKLIARTYLNHTTKIKREIQIMKECNHPNVVKLYQVIDDLKYDKILLIIEYCDQGEIDWKRYNHYNEKSKPNGLTINKILRDVANGLEYLHEYKGIIHRDLKPSNLLIKDNRIKISDFGVSLILENNANDAKELGKTMGTPAFFAPELCQFVNNRLSMISDSNRNDKIIDKRIDIWSLGVILYCLIFNDLPFNGKNEFGLFKNIVNKDLKFPTINFRSKLSESDRTEFHVLKDLILHILVKDPDKRYTIEDIKAHNFTTFDLNLTDTLRFKQSNEQIINGQLGFTSKIKKFFGGKPVENVKSIKVDSDEADYLRELEPVDDLLDSYFDSSSMGSIESDDDLDDTSEINESVPSKLNERVQAPPSLAFDNSKYVASPLLTSSSVSSTASSILSPHVVSIGPNSPSMYSPTRSFFDKIKSMDYKIDTSTPTLSSLTSKEDVVFEPPNVFNKSRRGSTSSRKNSFGSPLMRITSSSSSLNLNAYLTDDNFSINLRGTDSEVSDNNEEEEESDHESTFIVGDEDDGHKKFQFTGMHEYLDNLD